MVDENLLALIPGFDSVGTAPPGYYFDEEAAERALKFYRLCLRHVKGAAAGQRFELTPWQASIIANLFGWKRPDGTRRFRECFIYVPRKNGKTTLIAGLVLWMLFCDGEMGAEIYSAAADKDQATLIFQQCKGMVLQDPELAQRAKIYDALKSITFEELGNYYKAISAEADTKHGYNGHFIVVDELHAQPNRNLVDVLETSTGSRKQPLIVYITTADFERESICNLKLDYAEKVRDGVLQDPAFLPVIYAADREDDWTDPEVWAKANPNLGVSVSREYLARECQKAKDIPAYENTFKRLHLNIKTESETRWLALEKWDQCGTEPVSPDSLRGKRCYAALDLASTTDLCALALVFPDQGNAILPFFWAPRAGAEKRERLDRVPYLLWAKQGLLTLTDGDVVDYDRIRADLNKLGEVYDIQEIAIDRWNATQITNQLAGDGFEMVPFGQGFASMSAPTKHFEKLVLGGGCKHGGHPILRWMASNVTVEQDAAGNVKPSKKKSTERIDGIVAVIMAIGRIITESGSKKSVYQSRGLRKF